MNAEELSKKVCIVLVILLASTLLTCSNSHEICIAPNHDVHHNDSCYILDEFCTKNGIASSDVFITFLSGEHKLDTNCIFNGTNNLTLEGQPAEVKCSSYHDKGFTFFNVSALTVSNIKFIGCGANWTTTKSLMRHHTPQIRAALLFIGGSDHTLTNVSILDANPAGFYINNVAGNVNLDHCNIINASSVSLDTLSGNIVAYDYNITRTSFTIEHSVLRSNGFRSTYNIKRCGHERVYSFSSGLAFYLKSSMVSVSIVDTLFKHNYGCTGGNMALYHYSFTSVTISNTIFNSGISYYGGGVFVSFQDSLSNSYGKEDNSNSSGTFKIDSSQFIANYAKYGGGGMYVQWKRSYSLKGKYQVEIANSKFSGNYVYFVGSAGVAFHCRTLIDPISDPNPHSLFLVTLKMKSCLFTRHVPSSSPAGFVSGRSVILVENVPYFVINSINVTYNKCTGILAIGSKLVFYNSTTINKNSGWKGGGIRLCSDAVMYFTPNTTLVVTNNSAQKTGGGIQVYTTSSSTRPACFFQYSKYFSNFSTAEIIVNNNRAVNGGDNIYGGSIGHCFLQEQWQEQWLPSPLHVPSNTWNRSSSVSSDPQRVCFDHSEDSTGELKCSRTSNISIYPGEKITLPIRVVGQNFGTVSGTVLASIESGNATIKHDEEEQVSRIPGENITYTVLPDNFLVDVVIHLKPGVVGDSDVHSYFPSEIYSTARINIHFKQCPFGFVNVREKSSTSCKCITQPDFLVQCFIQNQTIMKPAGSWLGMYKLNNQSYLATNKYCPLDYCNNYVRVVRSAATNLSQDEQCQYNRTGILCGSCPAGWSLVLGSSECRQRCSNLWLLLIFPFALAGLLLVALIHFLNLTVTMGTVCGLIFYVNIIQDHAIALLSSHSIPGLTKVLTIFLSWLNLDLGISTCFYAGMGTFDKTMLLFLFPIYIWLISGVIILLSNRSVYFTTLVGNNAVKVLSTLFLLSYSKVIRIALSVFTFKYLAVHINSSVQVYKVKWILDGNMAYFSLKHSVVFVIAAIFIMLLLPFTFSLLCIRRIYSLSNCSRIFSWVDKLKPFFDTYTGPFTDKARFWTGLLLLVRLLLVILYVLDFVDNAVPYYIIIAVCLLLLTLMAYLRGVYQHNSLNALELFFILNISVIFLLQSCKSEPGSWISIFTHALVSSAFLVFLGVLLYHIYLKFSHCGFPVLWHFNRETNLTNFDDMRENEALLQIFH